jgi:acetyl esterase/lipase
MLQAEERVHQRYGPLPSQTVEWTGLLRARQSTLVIAVHGGFWRAAYGLDHLRPFCDALSAGGFAVASLEYRKLGEEGGGWPGTLEDVEQACTSIAAVAKAYAPFATAALLVGHSAGGHLALWAASRAPAWASLRLAGVVGLAAVSDLVEASRLHLSRGVVHEFLGGTPEAVPSRYQEASPAARLPLGVPTTLVHGTKDEDVPYAMSQAYVKRAQAAGDTAQLVTLEGGGHFDVITPNSAFWPQVVEAIESVG